MTQVVTGKIVTVPEILVLRRLHGDDAVLGIQPAPEGQANVDRTDAQERERLKRRYDNPTPDSEPLVDRLFGPAHHPLPKTLSDIGVDPAAQAAQLRAQAEAMAAAATALENEPAEESADVDELFQEAS
ncbi:hypothetical protein [Mycolicibacterium sp.]|uniref:hypothetical protein n=1 Tax=Mycolicibacterium sp. TaxID=2320850 RepID=UPI00355CA35F